MQIHHIGYVVKDISKSIEQFEELGFKKESGVVQDVARKVNISFLINNGYRIELVAPLGDQSPVDNFLGKVGESPYHICYFSKNIEADIKELTSKKYIVVEGKSPAAAFNGKEVVFLFRRNVGLIELVGE